MARRLWCTLTVILLVNVPSQDGNPLAFTPLRPISMPFLTSCQRKQVITTTFNSKEEQHHQALSSSLHGKTDDNDDQEQQNAPPSKTRLNWIEKSSPTGASPTSQESSSSPDSDNSGGIIDEYALGIDGYDFQLADLSKRFYDALLKVASKRSYPEYPKGQVPQELLNIYKMSALDLTAKEATKIALEENNLEFVVNKQNQAAADAATGEPGSWGTVEDIQLLGPRMSPEDKTRNVLKTFDSVQDAVESNQWEPGMPFSFVVRNIRARLKAMDLKTLLNTLNMDELLDDPDFLGAMEEDDDEDDDDEDDDEDDDDDDGATRVQQMEEAVKYDASQVTSLKALAKDCEYRCNSVPTRAVAVGFAGGLGETYQIVPQENLTLANSKQLTQALLQHGCLVIDLGPQSPSTQSLAGMWNATQHLFDLINSDKNKNTQEEEEGKPGSTSLLPSMEVAQGAGSRHAVVGYASYGSGSMQFLETRSSRHSSSSNEEEQMLPKELNDILGTQGVQAMQSSRQVMTKVGKEVVSLVAAEILREQGSTKEETEEEEKNDKYAQAVHAMVEDWIDDGTPTSSSVLGEDQEAWVNMSPHRMCRYTSTSSNKSNKSSSSSSSSSAKEVFGAHTDTSFVTLVPVAAVSGLEVYDGKAGAWMRPELMARRHWEEERLSQGLDLGNDENKEVPWHARYVVVVAGELLQLMVGGEIPSAVHRVVAMTEGDGGGGGGAKSRLSAPVLLRARNRAKMDVERYYGGLHVDGGSKGLWMDADGKSMEEVHDLLNGGAR